MTEPTPETDEPQPFDEFIADFRGGTLNDKLTAGLAELVEACQLLAKPGDITLKLKVRPESDGVTMAVRPDVTVKAPTPTEPAFPMFAVGSGRLSTQHPMNKPLPFKKATKDQ